LQNELDFVVRYHKK